MTFGGVFGSSHSGAPISNIYEHLVRPAPYKMGEFLPLVTDSEARGYVQRISVATRPLLDRQGHSTGNGVAITPKHILTSGHCVQGKFAWIRDVGVGEVVFNGSSPGRGNTDFKILFFAQAHFQAVPLSTTSEPGEGVSIQVYFEGNEQYVRCFRSRNFGSFAASANVAEAKTKPGESGAPRMSLYPGHVHAIHQGESQGLNFNEIYSVLQAASRDLSTSEGKVAHALLQQIQVPDRGQAGVNWSSKTIQVGEVDEEKPRVGGSVTLVEVINKKPVKLKFGYSEIGEGKGPRKISIFREGVAKSSVPYLINPNPHGNDTYNKGGQKVFYETLAKELGEYYLKEKSFPKGGTLKVMGEDYTLTKE